jgi:hypothetical protein
MSDNHSGLLNGLKGIGQMIVGYYFLKLLFLLVAGSVVIVIIIAIFSIQLIAIIIRKIASGVPLKDQANPSIGFTWKIKDNNGK